MRGNARRRVPAGHPRAGEPAETGWGGEQMRTELLEYFVAVCEAGSIHKASRRVMISQQGLSGAIDRLEKELGTILFLRSKSGVQLTEDGEILLKHARDILASCAQLELALSRGKLQKSGRKQVYMLYNPLYCNIMPEFLQALSRDLPEILCALHESENDRIPELLAASGEDCSFALMSCCYGNGRPTILERLSGMQIQVLLDDELVAFMGKGHPLAAKKILSAEDMESTQYIFCNSVSDAYIREWAGLMGNRERQMRLNAQSRDLLRYYLEMDDCVLVLPVRLGATFFDMNAITFRPIAYAGSQETLLVSRKKREAYSVEEKIFSEYFQTWLRNFMAG